MSSLTPRVIQYLASEEGLCIEAYKDPGNVWTWALGVTNASGHQVYPKYKDNPQTYQECFDVSIWLIKEKYLPIVLDAAPTLSEPQLAAALSFQWNTGRFKKYCSDFSKSVEINNRGLLNKRREREQKLYYEGVWPFSMRCPIYPVSHKSYYPIFSQANLIDPLPYIKL